MTRRRPTITSEHDRREREHDSAAQWLARHDKATDKKAWNGGEPPSRVLIRKRHALTWKRLRKWKRDAAKRSGYVTNEAKAWRDDPQA